MKSDDPSPKLRASACVQNEIMAPPDSSGNLERKDATGHVKAETRRTGIGKQRICTEKRRFGTVLHVSAAICTRRERTVEGRAR